ncbi:thioether cross-link-forming SCIFF peptide maturase [Spirochaetia bacterium]|nr:thioether cross-link-forming SCIFF peptide maturase [Spirochaetia bacterium]
MVSLQYLRVLWLEDGGCILFNSFDKRISGIEPASTGRLAEDLIAGKTARAASGQEEALAVIHSIAGHTAPFPYSHPNVSAKRFGKVIILCPSGRCSMACRYCSGNARNDTGRLMDWPLARAALDFFFAHTNETGPYTLQFHGAGEPMMNPGIVKKAIEYAGNITSQRGQVLYTRISTNGFYSEDTARWMADTFSHISLSLDGPPEIHNLQRIAENGDGTYETVIRSLRIFEEKGVLKRINAVITEQGINDMEKIIRHIRSVSGIKQLRLLPMEYCGRCETTDMDPLNFNLFTRNLEKLLPEAASLGLELLSPLEYVDSYLEYYCHACGGTMCVAPHGRISTCIEVMDESSGADELLIGAYQDNQIVIDWDRVMSLRKRNYRSIESCKECTFRNNCSGNCLVRAARKNGTVMSADRDSCERTKRLLSKRYTDMANMSGLLPFISPWNKEHE